MRDMSEVEDALKIFGSSHDLIERHDERLRSSDEVYSHVRTCFDMLYEYVGEGEKTERSYHTVSGVENWKLSDSVKARYETIIQDVSQGHMRKWTKRQKGT